MIDTLSPLITYPEGSKRCWVVQVKDARSLSPEAQEALPKRAVRTVLNGMEQTATTGRSAGLSVCFMRGRILDAIRGCVIVEVSSKYRPFGGCLKPSLRIGAASRGLSASADAYAG